MKQFKRIYIEITNCCNLSCSFCPETKRKLEYMSVSAFEEVLRRIKGHGEYIYLHLKGEPLLHPQLEEILDLCYGYQVKVNITTNGTMISSQMDAILKSKAIRQVSISIQSYEDLSNNKGFESYLNDILLLVKRGNKETNIIFELRLWNYEDEAGTISDIQRNKRALENIKEALDLSGDIFKAIPKGKGVKLVPNVYLSKAYEFQWPDISRDVISTNGTCYGLRQQIGILVNGDVVPCCLDSEGDIRLGNIFKSNFNDIITSGRSKAMIEGFERRRLVEPLCMRCGYRERF